MDDPCLETDALVELVEGRASPEARARIDGHAARCGSCRELLSALAHDGSSASRAAELVTGPERFGRYLLTHQLGAGAMGVVYAAHDPELDRVVAVKLLRSDRDPSMRERLRREAQAMAQLAHPNVVTVHDVGKHGDQAFLAMEYVDGETLARRLGTPRPADEILEAYRAAGRGLAAAHAAGIVHRDFKPENVLVGQDGRVRVSDFGLARATGTGDAADDGLPDVAARASTVPSTESSTVAVALTATGMVVGTPSYMAPELYDGAPADARSDQFSFCVALYRSLYGVAPFTGATFAELAASVTAGRLREPAAASRVPRKIRAAIRRGLAVEPSARFPSMDALLAELAPPRRAVRWTISLGALVAGGIALATWQASSAPEVRCTGAAAAFAPTWNVQHRAAILQSFQQSHLPYAPFAAQQVGGALDRYAAGWIAAHTDACRATRVFGQQTEAMLELQMLCLARRQQDAAALVEALTTSDPTVIGHAVTAVARLPELAGCADLGALKQIVPPPADPAQRREADALDRDLADVRAQLQVGQLKPALDRAHLLADRARTLGYRPLEAEAELLEAQLQQAAGDPTAAETTLHAAVWAAEAGRHDVVAARAWAMLVFVTGHENASFARAAELEQRASAAIARLGGNPRIEADLERGLGAIARDQLHEPDAIAHYEKALALRTKLTGPDSPEVAEALDDLGAAMMSQGHADRGVVLQQRALEVRERAFGPAHPAVALTLHGLANSHARLGQYAVAEAELRRSVAIREIALGANHPDLAGGLSDLANIVRRAGRAEEALALDRRAVAIGETAFGPEHPSFARQLLLLGTHLGALHHDAEAVTQMRRAEAILIKVQGADHVEVCHARLRLANVLMMQSRWREASELYRAALPILERPHGNANALVGTLVNLATAELEQHQPARALAAIDRLDRGPSQELNAASRGAIEFARARAEWDGGRDRRTARAHAVTARTELASQGDANHADVVEIDGWLAHHPLR